MKVAKRWSMLVTATVFGAWVAMVDEGRAEKRQQGILERMARRIKNSRLHQAWLTWEDNAGEMRRQRTLLEKMAKRMRNAGMLGAWATWEEHVKEIKRQRNVMKTIVMRMKSASVCLAFAAWEGGVKELQRQRELLATLKNSSVIKVFVTWADRCSQARHLRDLARRVLNTWTNGTILRALIAWNDIAYEQVQLRELEKTMLLPRADTTREEEYRAHTHRAAPRTVRGGPPLAKDLPVSPPSAPSAAAVKQRPSTWGVGKGQRQTENFLKERVGSGRIERERPCDKDDPSLCDNCLIRDGFEKRVLSNGKEAWVKKDIEDCKSPEKTGAAAASAATAAGEGDAGATATGKRGGDSVCLLSKLEQCDTATASPVSSTTLGWWT